MILKDGETLTPVNDNIELIQKKKGLTFGTDAYLLSCYMKTANNSVAVDYGCGTGIISLLCAAREKFTRIYAVDIQEEFCDIARRNAEHNGFGDRVQVLCSDVRGLKLEADIVFTNPPYMKSDSGKSNTVLAKNIARHEIHGNIDDFLASASRVLKYGGLFYAVYRPDRLCDLILAMRNNSIEPKRVTFVHSDRDHEPSVILVEGKKGAKPSLWVTKPLLLDGEDIKYIYENGDFPDEYRKK